MRKIKLFSFLAGILVVLTLLSSVSGGLRAADDTADIGTWRGFRKGAVSFTFEMGAPSHISHVAPLFDKYGYNATFYVVTNWVTDWDSLQKLSDNGHEIGSNSNSFPQNMGGEEETSKKTIDAKIKSKYGCITLGYPNGSVSTNMRAVEANYIAARTHDGSSSSDIYTMTFHGPSSWYEVPALLTGSYTNFKTTKNFTEKIDRVVNQVNGWVVFVTYGIKDQKNGPASYSPTDLSVLDGTLSWAKENDRDVWVAPLRDVAMYVQERKASNIVKVSSDQSSITYRLTHEIANDISNFDYPLSIRCPIPSGWDNVYVRQGSKQLETTTYNGKVYFDAIPNGEDIVVEKSKAIAPNVTLSQNTFDYDGTVKTPDVTVKDGDVVLKKDTDYKLTYDAGRTEPGTYNVKVTMTGKYSGSKTVSFTIKNPSLTLDKKEASIVCGKTLTLKAALKNSPLAVTWKSSDTKIATVDSKGKITAKMAGKVTITATAAGKTATCTVTVLYKDVTNSSDFWYAPTNYLTAKGVVKGYANQTEFRPANNCTRAQMVTFLYRLQGEPKTKSDKTKFTDVKKSDYFFKPVIWASEKGITTGVSKDKFAPKKVCTRAQTVTFLWRMAGKPEPGKNAKKFNDVKQKDYYYKATLWASDMKILAGYDDGSFRPDGKCLRRQMVTFLYKYDKYINKKG
ncbi:MAG: S-layer homology domain-containing protein [Saccharofermentans sp.]|nr:S-layer homology domain-containing protein [Saccharofermentans sp.]